MILASKARLQFETLDFIFKNRLYNNVGPSDKGLLCRNLTRHVLNPRFNPQEKTKPNKAKHKRYPI